MEFGKNIKKLLGIMEALREYREQNAHLLERNAGFVIHATAASHPNIKPILMQDVHVINHLKALDLCLELLNNVIGTQRGMSNQLPLLLELERASASEIKRYQPLSAQDGQVYCIHCGNPSPITSDSSSLTSDESPRVSPQEAKRPSQILADPVSPPSETESVQCI